MEDSTVTVVLDLNRRIDSARGDKVDDRAVSFSRGDFDGLLRFQVIVERDVKFLGTVEVE